MRYTTVIFLKRFITVYMVLLVYCVLQRFYYLLILCLKHVLLQFVKGGTIINSPGALVPVRNEENAPRRGGAEERFPSALGPRG